MNRIDMESLVKEWESQGLKGKVEINGRKQWVDFCAVEGMFGGPTLPCDWLEYDKENNAVYFKSMPYD